MHYLITGGAGFIGSHLVEKLLQDGNKITVIDDFNTYYDPEIKRLNTANFIKDVNVVEGDIRDADLIDRLFSSSGFDQVMHLAARAGVRPSIKEPKLYFSTNIDGTYNLLDACRQYEVMRFTFASSSSVYGINTKIPFSEDDALGRTISPYAASKMAGEQICSNYSHLFGIKCQCLRLFTVYGPRQRPDLAISKFTRSIYAGDIIKQYGDGNSIRDYTYIEDIINGIVAASKYDVKDYDVFNLGGAATTTLADLIAMIEAASGKKAVIERMPDQPGDVPLTFADVSKARRLLGYQPKTPVAEGIRKYVTWYCESRT